VSKLTRFFDDMHGVILPYGGATAPQGALMCYGQAVSRSTYAALFGVIGTTYGAGDGSATFNVPDLRGRVPAGRDNMGGVAAGRLTGGSAAALDGTDLGLAGGSQEQALTTAQMPLHGHPYQQNTSSESGTSSGNGGALITKAAGATSGNVSRSAYTGAPSNSVGQSIGGSGGSQPHSNVQPTLIINYIIVI